MQQNLIIFVKNPVLGTVKTRLAKSIGNEAALNIYHQLLVYTMQVVSNLKAEKSVWYSSKIETNDMWDNQVFKKELQSGEDLGEKMKNAFMKTFDTADAAVIIGSDCAELEGKHIHKAFVKLKSVDIVIGPAKDGGYYLLGMRKFVPELFESITWSTSTVAYQTIAKVKKLGLTFQLLDELNDVDTLEDWKQVKHRLPSL